MCVNSGEGKFFYVVIFVWKYYIYLVFVVEQLAKLSVARVVMLSCAPILIWDIEYYHRDAPKHISIIIMFHY